MTLPLHLKRRAAQAQDWMLSSSFPLWAGAGLHPVAGFQERLDLSGAPTHDPISRVRLQARQVYCFSLAKRLGWDQDQSAALIYSGLDVLTQHCQRGDGLYGKHVTLGEGLSDAQADLYDTAFVLLAFCSAASAGVLDAEPYAAAAASAIDTHLARAADGCGYLEALPAPDRRLQNPHMHLFEASIAHYKISKDQTSLARTRALRRFIEGHFYDPHTHSLQETTHLDGSAHDDNVLEAGHHYEWAWLLHWHARETGDALSPIAKPLYETARRLTDASGRIALAHNPDFTIKTPRYRTWSQTEALKAHIAAFENGWVDGAEIACCFDLLWADHILPAPKGAWIDCVDAQGGRLVSDITAATGYHLFGAFQELMQTANAL